LIIRPSAIFRRLQAATPIISDKYK
jgi:hypothetical protein